MKKIFNFTRLHSVYLEALNSFDKTLVFESQVGRGRFLFMMFLSDEEDMESKDMLFLFLRNTNRILKIKTYGNHKKGKFEVYLKDEEQNYITEELQLNETGKTFDFDRFLDQLNCSIPLTIPVEEKINKIRANRNIIRELNVVDEADKTVLIGDKKLPVGSKPRDKTLRKLYLYTDGAEKDIALLIELLKKANRTVAWTTEDRRGDAADIRAIINQLN